MSYFESTQDLIGNTPIVKLSHLRLPEGVNLFAKLELYNPGGSVKDRVGRAMIEDAEKKGLLKPGGTIVEGTAGNTGLGIAFAALNRGHARRGSEGRGAARFHTRRRDPAPVQEHGQSPGAL